MYKDGKLSKTLTGSLLGLDDMIQNVQIKLSDQLLTEEAIPIYSEAVLNANTYIYEHDFIFVKKSPGSIVEEIVGLFTERKKN